MPDRRPRSHQSAVTNGTRIHIAVIDTRTAEGRRFADVLHAVEMERGGRAAMTVTAWEAARQYAALVVLMERLQGDLAAGKLVDIEALGQLGDRADRQSRRMGAPKPAARRTILDQLTGR